MKALDLTTFERKALVNWVNQQKGNLSRQRRLLQLLDTLELTEQEEEEVGLRQNGRQQTWQDTTLEFPLTFDSAQFKILKEAIVWDNWVFNPFILTMLEKIEQAKEVPKKKKEEA